MISLAVRVFCSHSVLAEIPPSLSTWTDLDSAVEDAYAGLTNDCSVFPSGNGSYEISNGYYLFASGSEIESSTNFFRYSPRMGIPVWSVRITETQQLNRVWLYEGAGDAPFRTNNVPADFDPEGWVGELYGESPGWLNATEEDQWYAGRDRSRLRVTLSLIASNNWPLLEAEWQQALTNAAPTNSNRIAFTDIDLRENKLLSLQFYTPTNPIPVEIYSSSLLSTNGLWSFAGLLDARGPFDCWLASMDQKSFFNAARGDIDSDGDGIPDGRESLVHGTSSALSDSDDDGLSDRAELYQYMTDPNLSDCDDDTIPDGWEVGGGMNPFDATDVYADPDSDHLYNLHEYWIDSDPQLSDTNMNYAIADAMRAVDDSIAGVDPAIALEIFSVQDHSATNYLRNTNCWAVTYDLTCCSPWNSYSDVYGEGKNRAGTLISPRHVIFAAHYDQITTNDVLRFVDLDNNVIERRLVAKKQHPEFAPGPPDWYPDFTVGLLESDLPTNLISFALVLPNNYHDYIGSGRYLPALCLDQEEKAIIADLWAVVQTNIIEGVECLHTVFEYPVDTNRLNYSEEIIVGDSGNPSFLLLDGKLVLLTVWTDGGPGAGSSVTALKDDINQLMSDLGGGYQLTEIDLSGFD